MMQVYFGKDNKWHIKDEEKDIPVEHIEFIGVTHTRVIADEKMPVVALDETTRCSVFEKNGEKFAFCTEEKN